MRLRLRATARGLKARAIILPGMALAAVAAATAGQAAPALAAPVQPVEVLNAVGTAATQEVFNQYAVDAAGNLLASWNADGGSPLTYTDASSSQACSYPRPSGSVPGLDALRISVGLLPPPVPPAQEVGCVDIARVASAPGAGVPNGALAWLEFALDGVAAATGPASCAGTPGPCAPYQSNGVTVTPVPTAITQADLFTVNDLKALYACMPVTEGGVTYDPNSPPGPGATPIHLYVPQAGSVTRSFWAAELGFSSTTLPACVHDVIVGGPLAGLGAPVGEDDGTAVATDPSGLMPFSIPGWISARNHLWLDQRHAAALHSLQGISPFSNGNPATGALNVSFPFAFTLYNVAPYARVTNPGDPLFSLMNGPSSTICQDSVETRLYGFGFSLANCGIIVARTN
jgi:hypothetical protein